MKDTYILKDKPIEPLIIKVLFLIGVFIFGIGGLYLIADALATIFAAMSDSAFGHMFFGMLPFLVGLFTFKVCLITLIMYTRTCIIDEKGFTIISCKWFRKKYCWSDINSIVLCDANYYSSHYGDMYDIVIRISVATERFGPLSKQKAYPIFTLTGAESWRTLAYARKHLNKVFLFRFTQERYETICRMSGLEIVECISKQAREEYEKIVVCKKAWRF